MKKSVNLFLIAIALVMIISVSSASALQINRTGESSENIFTQRHFSSINISDPYLSTYFSFDFHNIEDPKYPDKNFTYNLANTSLYGEVFGAFHNSSGYINGSYYFRGNNDDIKLSKNIKASSSNPKTFVFWAKKNLSNLDSPNNVFGNSGGLSPAIGLYVGKFLVYDDSGDSFGEDLLTIDNNWHLYTLSINESLSATLYQDTSQLAVPTNLADSLTIDQIGASASYDREFTNGSLDEIMVFDKALNQTEIEKIYNRTYSRFHDDGNITYEGLNLSSQGNTSLNFEDCQTYNGSYIQGRINQGEWVNFSNCSFSDSSFSGDLSSVNFTVRAVSNENNFYSPSILGTLRDPLPDSYFSNASDLTWPPTNYSDDNYGAWANPTGDPIGGFVNYSRIVDPDDATYYVNAVEEFDEALNNIYPGEVIYINDSVTLELNETKTIDVQNITIASGRGEDYSKGATIIGDPKPSILVTAPHVRITGLRFDGQDMDKHDDAHDELFPRNISTSLYRLYGRKVSVEIQSPDVEIDNCEILGNNVAGISSSAGALNNYIHHNHIYGNNLDGTGYGVREEGSNNLSRLIEANLFNHNRHSIASTGYNNSFEARYNIDLKEAMGHPSFDRHGSDGYGGTGGNYTIYHHNSFYRYPQNYLVEVMGDVQEQYDEAGEIRAPPIKEKGGQIYNNWIQHYTQDLAFYTTQKDGTVVRPPTIAPNITIFNNLYNTSTNSQYSDPIAIASSNATIVSINETVSFDASSSYSPENSIRYMEWDFADNTSLDYGETVSHSFSKPGRYKVKTTTYDQNGFMNSTYTTIRVVPEDSTKRYLNFWMFENSEVKNSSILRKKIIADGQTIWTQNFSDNVSEWKHINVEIPSNLTLDGKVNLTIGVEVLKNYTDPVGDNESKLGEHQARYFQLFFDSVSLIGFSNDSLTSDGDFDEGIGSWGNKTNLTSGFESAWQTSWETKATYYRKRNGKFSYALEPPYLGNYSAGDFVGITREITIDSFGVKDIPANKHAILKSDTSRSVSEWGQSGVKSIVLGNNQSGNYAGLIDINFSQDINLSNVTMDTDRGNSKSVVHGLSEVSQVSNKSLLIPRTKNSGRIYVCPGAESLSDVSTSCPNYTQINSGETKDGMTVSETTINGENYYKVSNITGTGGGELDIIEDEEDTSTSGGSASNILPSKTHSWLKLEAGEKGTTTEFDSEFGIKDISVKVKDSVENAGISVTKHNSTSYGNQIKEGKVYQYLEINSENFGEELSSAVINFRVEKSWMENNSVVKEDMIVSKYDEESEEWNELEINYNGSDEEYHYYTVAVEEFSLFAISEKVVESGDTEDETTGNGTETGEETGETEKEKSYWYFWVLGIIIVGLVVWFVYNRNEN